MFKACKKKLKRSFVSLRNFLLLSLVLIVTEAGFSAEQKPSGEILPLTIELSGDWDFTYTNPDYNSIPDNNTFEVKMPVPGCWDDYIDRIRLSKSWSNARFNKAPVVEYPMQNLPPHAELPYLLGTGWYRKTIDIPEEWRGRQITLDVGRIVMEAKVYVNGAEVYHHIGHSTTWQAPLEEYLKLGQTNELIIAVDNTSDKPIGCMIRGFQGRSGGIFGLVSLKVTGAGRIADFYVWPGDANLSTLNWHVELQGQPVENAQLRWTVHEPVSGELLGQGACQVNGQMLNWTSENCGMKPWSDRKPNLYKIEVSLLSGQDCLDVHHQRFGLRRLTTEGFGLRLNGKPIFLRGVCDHSYYPETCTPPTGPVWYRRHVRRLKELGFNWLRFHTSVPLEAYLDAADEFGMLVQVEAHAGMGKQEWLDIFRFCRKHPSVVLYCGGNEELLDEVKIEFLRQRAAELRQLVPDALFNPQEALRGVEYCWETSCFGDGLVEQPYQHNPGRLEKLKEFSDVLGQYAWGTLSYNSLDGNNLWLDERLAVYKRPCLSHEMGILGSYINLDIEHRYENSRIGTGIFRNIRRNLAEAGLINRARQYYLNSCAWQRLLFKDVMETARKTKRLAGYDLLGANDSTWLYNMYNCGIMNEFDELKPCYSVSDVLSYNGESVLLLAEQRKRNLPAGQKFEAEVLLSWFGAETLQKAIARWYFQSDDGAVLCRGEQPIKSIEPGNVEKIMTISFTAPKLEKPFKAKLEVRLSGPVSELNNHWDYWVFPEKNVCDKSNVKVVSELSAEDIRFLADGGSVILFGNKPFRFKEAGFRVACAGRTTGNLATVIADHPLTNRFPNDGYCDWQFYPMLSNSTAIVFDDMQDVFEPIIEVVSTYKNVIKQASLFEWKVGSGRLLVCTLNLPQNDPGAAYLLWCISDYVNSRDFQPRIHVSPEQLGEFTNLVLPSREESQQDKNRAYDEAAHP